MIRLALAGLRHRPGGYVGTFVACMLAVALLAGGGLLLSSVLTAQAPANRFAAAPLMVSGTREVTVETVKVKHKGDHDKIKRKTKSERLTGAGTLPAALAGRIASVGEVDHVVADVAFPAQVAGPDGKPVRGAQDAPVIGHGWASAELTPFRLTAGRPPGTGEAVVDADLASRAHLRPGSTLTVTTRTGGHRLEVSGIAAPATGDGLPAQGALFVGDDDVAAISGLTGPTAIGVFPKPGASVTQARAGVERVAGAADVLTGDDRVRADLPGAMPDYIAPISIFGFVIGITAFAAVFVLVGTVTLQVRQRLRDLALLRSSGATPGQLRRLLGIESATIAGLAALPALPLAVVFAHVVSARFKTLGAVPRQFTVATSVPVLLAAAAVGVLLSVVAARLAGRRAVRIAPTQALVETATTPTGGVVIRLLLGVITAAGAIAVLVFVPLDGPFGMGMCFISSALLLCTVAATGPIIVGALVAVVSRPLGLSGVLARSGHRRIAAVAVPLVLMFAINAPMMLASALTDQIAGRQQAERTAPATTQVSGGLPLGVARALAAEPGVAGSAALIPTRIVLVSGGKPQDYAAQGILASGTEPALDLGLQAGHLDEDGVAISAWLAKQFDWKVGEAADVWLADGVRTRLPITAIYERSRGFGDMVVPAGLVAAHDPVGLVRTVALNAGPGTTARLRAAHPELQFRDVDSAIAAGDASEQQGAWELLVIISLAFTAIAVVNTFVLAALARRREYADLRLAGATAAQIHRIALVEAGLSVATALLIGGGVTGIVVGAFSHAQDGVIRWLVDPVQYAGLAGAVAALGLVAGVLPTRLMMRRRQLPAQI